MLEDHAKVVQFMSLAGEVTGRKKLQKMIYIAKKFDMSFVEKYTYQISGPYSDELTVRIEELCNLGFVEERTENTGSHIQYCYSITKSGEQFTSIIEEAAPQFEKLVHRMNDEDAHFLELVSMLLYFEELPREEQIKKINVSMNVSEEMLQQALDFIDELHIIQH